MQNQLFQICRKKARKTVRDHYFVFLILRKSVLIPILIFVFGGVLLHRVREMRGGSQDMEWIKAAAVVLKDQVGRIRSGEWIDEIQRQISAFFHVRWMGALIAVALRLSEKMMAGHKRECFLFDLSFLGWSCLSLFTLGLVRVLYFTPYYTASFAEYYMHLKGVRNQDDERRQYPR